MSWLILGAIVAIIAVVLVLVFRSLRRWKQLPPTDPDTIQAEARMWGQRGGGDM
jgi:membrane protein implicated in regulation of membrane protease activity